MSAKKTYENPALAFMSRPRPVVETPVENVEEKLVEKEKTNSNEEPIKTNPERIRLPRYRDRSEELRSRRFQALFKPSVFKQLNDYSEAKKISINEAIERLIVNMIVIEESAEKNGMTLEEYHQKIMDSVEK